MWENTECVLTLNSVLSDSDIENRALPRQFSAVLPAGGALAGFFASIHTPLEMGYLQHDRAMLTQVDIAECRLI